MSDRDTPNSMLPYESVVCDDVNRPKDKEMPMNVDMISNMWDMSQKMPVPAEGEMPEYSSHMDTY